MLAPFPMPAQPKSYVPITDLLSFKKKFAEASKTITSIKCDFTQEKNLSVLSEKISSKGTFMFRRSNMARMEYTQPFKYLLIINGDKVSIKDDHKTSTFSSKNNKLFENINKIMIDCVQGTALNNTNFSSSVYENDKQYLLELTPLNKKFREYFNKIDVYINKKDYSLNKLDMIDTSGDNTVLTFLNKQFNTNLSDALFTVK
jgi:outer membrane lipoprotein-sorting protein